MSIDLKRLSRVRVSRKSSDRAEHSHETDLPLDHQLTFNPDPNQEWRYRSNHVYINGEDVNELINDNPRDISFLSSLTIGLDEYKNFVWGRGGKKNAKFNASVAGLQSKIAGRLGLIYDEVCGGVRCEFDDEALWVNNVNVRAVVALYKMRPTTKAREYLKGLRLKLFLIIERPHSNPRNNGMQNVVRNYIDEIDGALDFYTPTDTPLLVADTRRESECAG